MIRVLVLMLATLPAFAVDVMRGEIRNATCTAPTQYENGQDIVNDTLKFTFYQDGAEVGTGTACTLTVDTSAMQGEYIYTATATSKRFGTQSVISNPVTLNVLVPQTPNAPTLLQWQ